MHHPEGHTALLSPHENYVGGMLKPSLRVVRAGGRYRMDRVSTPRQHPLHLYAMGVLPADKVPDLEVFNEQRYHGEVGATVVGGTRTVTIEDIVSKYGPRVGPVRRKWRRAVIVISTGGLLSRKEMNFYNFMAKRLSARSDATDYNGVPTFFESVDGAVELRSDVEPTRGPKLKWTGATTARPYSPRAWSGLVFDQPVPTKYEANRTYVLRGKTVGGEVSRISFVQPNVENDSVGFQTADLGPGNGRFEMRLRFPRAGSYGLSTFVTYVAGETLRAHRSGFLVTKSRSGPGELPPAPPPRPDGPCRPDAETLCLHDHRYEVRVEWRKGDGVTGQALVVPETTPDSGLFQFFDPDNWEILIKVLNGCEINGHYWVYGTSTTDLGYVIRVWDTTTGSVKEYRNEPGQPASAITDTNAFPDSCKR